MRRRHEFDYYHSSDDEGESVTGGLGQMQAGRRVGGRRGGW